MCLMVIAYTRLRNLHRKTWGGWTWESLGEWGLFTKLGVPGLFMICFEWWAVEVVTFVAGSIGETELAINTILIQPLIIMFMVRGDSLLPDHNFPLKISNQSLD